MRLLPPGVPPTRPAPGEHENLGKSFWDPSDLATDASSVVGGPNEGYHYVTLKTHQPTYRWVITEQLDSTSSQFYQAQCGDYDAALSPSGFISGAALRANTIHHEFEVALCPVETGPFDPSATAKIDIAITNLSDKAIDLPGSVDWRQVWEDTGKMPDNYLGMDLSIHARRLPGPNESAQDRKGRERSVALALCSFYGTRAKPTTIRPLAPGRRVRVRTSLKLPGQAGEWQLRGSVSFPSGLDPHFYAASDPVLLTIRSSEQGNNTP